MIIVILLIYNTLYILALLNKSKEGAIINNIVT